MNQHRISLAALVAVVALGACVSTTTVQLAPSPQPSVCQSTANALVLWAPQWRPNQKDISEREAAAADGITQFFAKSGCFSSATVQRIAQPSAAEVAAALSKRGHVMTGLSWSWSVSWGP